ncbi:replication protein A DNA-binding subunit B-like isoform X2 [Carex littledalei]|uniref:Replication protein A DNA-binding subunit B-like isoform X2 n=1 Tax=Carex littledalei TaxID=544730 RepID=A0A833W102_9POAL|nr:replication protein A DNA-binding subunit B-like isoform X2 [Carex littledalei]
MQNEVIPALSKNASLSSPRQIEANKTPAFPLRSPDQYFDRSVQSIARLVLSQLSNPSLLTHISDLKKKKKKRDGKIADSRRGCQLPLYSQTLIQILVQIFLRSFFRSTSDISVISGVSLLTLCSLRAWFSVLLLVLLLVWFDRCEFEEICSTDCMTEQRQLRSWCEGPEVYFCFLEAVFEEESSAMLLVGVNSGTRKKMSVGLIGVNLLEGLPVATLLANPNPDSGSNLPEIVLQVLDLRLIGNSSIRYMFMASHGKMKIKAMLPTDFASEIGAICNYPHNLLNFFINLLKFQMNCENSTQHFSIWLVFKLDELGKEIAEIVVPVALALASMVPLPLLLTLLLLVT